MRVWRLTDGAPLGDHGGAVTAVAVGGLPDETPVIVSGGDDGTVRAWRLPDGNPLGPPLWLTGRVADLAMHDSMVVAAAGADIAIHLPAFLRSAR